MGIFAKGGNNPLPRPADTPQNRYSDLANNDIAGGGSILGQVIADVKAVANSANDGVGAISDGMSDLEARQDLLDPMVDFGQSYMPTGTGFRNAGRLPFSNQRGPARGIRIENNGMRLLGQGAWQITCEVRPSWIRIATHRIIYRINCYDPQGQLYTYQEFIDYTSNEPHTVSFGADFVVPDPNYFVAVHVYNVGTGRAHLGGWAATRLVAKRWSSTYINPPEGGDSETEAES